jgi:DNA-binding response OmpR family regulator
MHIFHVLVKYNNPDVVSIDFTCIFDLPKTNMLKVKNPKDPIVYIIDNSHTYSEIIKNCLEALNFCKIYTFSKCEDIAVVQLSPDIVILDHELGINRMKGFDFFKEYKTQHPETHFIFFSSDTSIEVAVSSIKTGAYDYIIKSKAGLERLIKRFHGLIASQIRMHYRKKVYNVALVSLSMVSLVFIVAIILYNHQIF